MQMLSMVSSSSSMHVATAAVKQSKSNHACSIKSQPSGLPARVHFRVLASSSEKTNGRCQNASEGNNGAAESNVESQYSSCPEIAHYSAGSRIDWLLPTSNGCDVTARQSIDGSQHLPCGRLASGGTAPAQVQKCQKITICVSPGRQRDFPTES